MNLENVLNLSIGDVIPDSRLAGESFSDDIRFHGKRVRFDVSAAAVRQVAEQAAPVVVELELYFSCLVRKQVRFRRFRIEENPGASLPTAVMPGLFALFRAVTTAECRISEVEDGRPPVAVMPVKKPDLFVPDWVRIDYRAGNWRGEYGFARRL